ncbi:MAG: D-alanyl-D-alanine carboxypeptidase, partial [Acidimicrobiia bacterium]
MAAALDPVWRDTPGGCLRVTAGDRVLYEANPDSAVVPASVTKLLTAAAALGVVGDETRYDPDRYVDRFGHTMTSTLRRRTGTHHRRCVMPR